jgi:hypothetical protein
MSIKDLTSLLTDFHSLNVFQQENLKGLLAISRIFNSDAGIPNSDHSAIGPDSIVLESGHQPNFLPYSGVWKKAFLLDSIRKELTVCGKDAVAVFGFSDHILSTASYLSQNQILAYKKQGKENIGFKIPEQDRWRCFHYLSKPTEEQLHREIEKIKRCYSDNFRYLDTMQDALKHRMGDILELLSECYHLATSFADFNAFFFSRMCTDVYGFQLHFFRYSDVFEHGLLINESRKILSQPDVYSSQIEAAIAKTGSISPPLAENAMPFWYHCDCGGKIHLSGTNPSDVGGTCPVCKKNHLISLGPNLDSLGNYYSRMSPNAIARNMIFSEGFGTTLFISGTGGGLKYGQVADAVSIEMGFHRPLTIAWRSADMYLGAVHNRAIQELIKIFRLKITDLLESRINEKIRDCRGALERKLNEMEVTSQDKKATQKLRGKYLNSLVQAETVRNVFSETPSLLDILMTFDSTLISEKWRDTLLKVDIRPDGYWLSLQGDILYPYKGIQGIMSKDIPNIYHAMKSIEVE